MSGFAAVIDVGSLTAAQGVVIRGLAANDQLGRGVAAIGDMNGDGIDDFMVGAFFADANGADSGAAYVVFGTTAGLPLTLDLNTLDGTNGFRIAGPSASALGYTGAGADVNGDGFGDLIIGSPLMGGGNRGGAYVVYGHDGPFAATLNVTTPAAGVSSRITTSTSNELMGFVTQAVGDLNGDGLDDFVVASPRASHGIGSNAGAAYVIFGAAAGLPLNLNLDTDIDGLTGFEITGQNAGWELGTSAARAGDFNGDGRDDLIIGAGGYDLAGSDNTGAAFVIYGAANFGAELNLNSLDGTAGFKITGPFAGSRFGLSVASAGDYDGDGRDDLVVGWAGNVTIIYGEATPRPRSTSTTASVSIRCCRRACPIPPPSSGWTAAWM